MKRGFSLLLVLSIILSLFGFTPARANAETIDLRVLDPSQANVQREMKKPDFTAGEIQNLKDHDPDQMVRVIVELGSDSVIETATKANKKVNDLGQSRIDTLERTILADQAKVKANLNRNVKMADKVPGKRAAGESLTIALNGFSTYLRLGDLTEALNTPGVSNVTIANEYERPAMLSSGDQVNAPAAWGYGYKGEGTVVAIIDSGIDPDHKDFNITDESKAALSESVVEELKERTDLPGRFYNIKVPYAYNYYDLNHQVLDRSTDGQHGMHVAGTVAANGEITGIAPEAQLLGMKVFSDDVLYATTFSDIYLKAIDDAITLGADAINMSLGSPAGFYVIESREDEAINNARDNGITVAISAGNERNTMNGSANFADALVVYTTNQAKNPDNGVVGSPSVNQGSLSVASFENTRIYTQPLKYYIDEKDPVSTLMLSSAGSPDPYSVFGADPVEVFFAGLGKAEDFTEDLSGRIALISRGEIGFAVKLANAKAVHAAGVIVFNNQGDDMVNMAGGETAGIPYVFIGQTAGTAMANAYLAGSAVAVSFTNTSESLPNPSGNTLSAFSSWGATPGLRLKPEISAPGGMIYSTQNNDTYGTMSGTSMAAPCCSPNYLMDHSSI